MRTSWTTRYASATYLHSSPQETLGSRGIPTKYCPRSVFLVRVMLKQLWAEHQDTTRKDLSLFNMNWPWLLLMFGSKTCHRQRLKLPLMQCGFLFLLTLKICSLFLLDSYSHWSSCSVSFTRQSILPNRWLWKRRNGSKSQWKWWACKSLPIGYPISSRPSSSCYPV